MRGQNSYWSTVSGCPDEANGLVGCGPLAQLLLVGQCCGSAPHVVLWVAGVSPGNAAGAFPAPPELDLQCPGAAPVLLLGDHWHLGGGHSLGSRPVCEAVSQPAAGEGLGGMG